jgi:hypothetical protein
MSGKVYKIRCSTRAKRFHNRTCGVVSFGDEKTDITIIPVGDTEVICNGCNANVYDEEQETYGWLIYLSAKDVKDDTPYDFYCDTCTNRMWHDAVELIPKVTVKSV